MAGQRHARQSVEKHFQACRETFPRLHFILRTSRALGSNVKTVEGVEYSLQGDFGCSRERLGLLWPELAFISDASNATNHSLASFDRCRHDEIEIKRWWVRWLENDFGNFEQGKRKQSLSLDYKLINRFLIDFRLFSNATRRRTVASKLSRWKCCRSKSNSLPISLHSLWSPSTWPPAIDFREP